MLKDAGYKETDKELERIEKTLKKEYKKAADEVQVKLNKYMQTFVEQDRINFNKVLSGQMTDREYKEWRMRHIAIGERWNTLRDKLAEDYTKADKTTRMITDGYMANIYAINFNYTTYQIEHDAGIDTAFTLYNRNAVNRLVKDNPELLPKPSAKTLAKIKSGELQRYNQRALQSALIQSILQGESIDKMAKRIAKDVGEKNYNSAVRNARTMVTGAQNGARLDAMHRAEEYGVKGKKQWLAVHDGRTRDSHRMLDYDIVPIDEEFKNGLMYPAEPSGDPAEVYNCRCAMRELVEGLEPQARKYMNKEVEGQSYEEWKQGHATEKPKNVVSINPKDKRSLIDAYEYHRTANNLTSVSAKDLPNDFISIDYSNMQERSAEAFTKTISDLSKEYDTPLTKIRVMDKNEALLHRGSFAYTYHEYSVDTATMVINPVKCGNYERYIDTIKDLSKSGYAVDIKEGLSDRYVATHEFAHTLFDTGSNISNKTNFVNADYAKLKKSRESLNEIYNKYTDELGKITAEKKKAEMAYIMGDAKAGEKARELTKAINKVKISDYSLTNADEFMAEAFTQAKLSDKKNKYVDMVMELIDGNYRRR